MKEAANTVRIGDDAVKAKTGKDWNEWFKVLDRAGAKKMNHTAIATYLYDQEGCPGWWCQMVAVGYEQARGLREKHQTTTGYEISVSRTLRVSDAVLFSAWHDDATRARWLPKKGLAVRKATPNKSMRISWGDGQTNLDVRFYPKGAQKTQVAVQHQKLGHRDDVAKMKAYWAKALTRLEMILPVQA